MKDVRHPGARRSKGPTRAAKEIIAVAEEMGFEYLGLSGRGHLQFRRPGCPLVTASASPSCAFAKKNAIGDLRRALAAGGAA